MLAHDNTFVIKSFPFLPILPPAFNFLLFSIFFFFGGGGATSPIAPLGYIRYYFGHGPLLIVDNINLLMNSLHKYSVDDLLNHTSYNMADLKRVLLAFCVFVMTITFGLYSMYSGKTFLLNVVVTTVTTKFGILMP